jgi:hypothetical protein
MVADCLTTSISRFAPEMRPLYGTCRDSGETNVAALAARFHKPSISSCSSSRLLERLEANQNSKKARAS